MLKHNIIVYSNISGSLISDMNVVSLLDKTYECSSHGDDIIVRMRREYHNSFRERCRWYRTCTVICIRLSARPA